MKLFIILSFLWLTCDLLLQPAVAGDSLSLKSLKTEGTLLRLRGDFDVANRISDQLKESFPKNAIGYTFNLNTLMTRLSWYENDPSFDQTILDDGAAALSLCQNEIEENPRDFHGYYNCGQAHFILTYLHAVRGNYYRAGTNGSETIYYLEETLQLNPALSDAKLHLGIAYYFADNLPPFVKVFSKYLWFIPTGNSRKSLPYVKKVTEEGEFFKDVAKYIYVDLLLKESEENRLVASEFLWKLVKKYPENKRFHIRYISLLVEMEKYRDAQIAVENFVSTWEKYNRDEIDIVLARLWATRAFFSLQDASGAIAVFGDIEKASPETRDRLPSWAKPRFSLIHAQILDLRNQRAAAVERYRKVVSMGEKYVGSKILKAAKKGLKVPFSLTAEGNAGDSGIRQIPNSP